MEYQIYEIMVFFSLYSILGWLANICCSALTDSSGCSGGVCRGPWCTSFGIGALAVLGGAAYFGADPVKGFLLGFGVGLVMEILSMMLINGMAGQKLVRLKWYHPILFGLSGALLVYHLHPLTEALVCRVNPWVHFVLLILFWMVYPGQVLEGLAVLAEGQKEKRTIEKEME